MMKFCFLLLVMITVGQDAWAVTALAPQAEPNAWLGIVDFLIDNAVKPVLAVAIPSLVGLAMAWVAQRLKKNGIEIDQAKQDRFESAATKSLEWALSQLFDQISKRGPAGWADPEIHRQVIAQAQEYMVDRFPDTVKDQVGSTSLLGAAQMSDPVMTRLLPKVITEVAASPASPPAPVTAVPVVDVASKS